MAIDFSGSNTNQTYRRRQIEKTPTETRFTGKHNHPQPSAHVKPVKKKKQYPVVKREPPAPRPPLDMDKLVEDCALYRTCIPRSVPRLDKLGLQLNLSPKLYAELIDDIRLATMLSITRIDECVEACNAVLMFLLRNEMDPEPYIKTGVRIRKR